MYLIILDFFGGGQDSVGIWLVIKSRNLTEDFTFDKLPKNKVLLDLWA